MNSSGQPEVPGKLDPYDPKVKQPDPGGGMMSDSNWNRILLLIFVVGIIIWLVVLTFRTQCCTTTAASKAVPANVDLKINRLWDQATSTSSWQREMSGPSTSTTWAVVIAEEVDRLCREIKKVNDKIDAYHPNGVPVGSKVLLDPCPGPATKYPPPPPPPFP